MVLIDRNITSRIYPSISFIYLTALTFSLKKTAVFDEFHEWLVTDHEIVKNNYMLLEALGPVGSDRLGSVIKERDDIAPRQDTV